MIRITCPECINRAKALGFAVPANQAGECLNWMSRKERKGEYILARNTTAKLDQEWRQAIPDRKRPAIWKPEHKFSIRENYGHVEIVNSDLSKAPNVRLCSDNEHLTLDGPGAMAHIDNDAEAVSARDEKDRLAEIEKATKEALDKEMDNYCDQIAAGLAALGFNVNTNKGFMANYATRISFSADDAAKILEILGTPAPRRAVDPMPIWEVRYGETPENDDDPLILGARTESAVRAYMMSRYCDERREDGPSIPLKPEKLWIKKAQ